MYTICQTSYANLVMLLVYNKYLEIDYYSISNFATAPIRPERHIMILKFSFATMPSLFNVLGTCI